MILHSIIGGITAKLGGNTYQAGAMAGAVNEAMSGAIREYEEKTGKRIDAATHQWLSVAVGVIVNQAAGMSMQTGAAEAVYGTKWNYLTEDNQKKLEEFLNKALKDPNWEIDDTIYLLSRFGEVSGYNYNKEKEKYNIHKDGTLPAEVVIWEKKVLIKDAMNKVAKHYAVDFAYNNHVDITGNMRDLLDKLEPKSQFGTGKSVVENMTAEKTNMVPEMLLKEKYIVSPVLKGAIKAGGVGIFMTGADVLDAYNKYSGKELLMAEGANLLPIAGAFIGTSSGGFITAGLFATAGDKLKYELLKNVQTRHQKEIDKVVNKFLEGA